MAHLHWRGAIAQPLPRIRLLSPSAAVRQLSQLLLQRPPVPLLSAE